MKKAAMAALVVLASCATQTTAQKQTTIKYRTIQSGSMMQVQSSQPRAIIAKTEKEYEIWWSTVIGASVPPKIDFSKEQAVILCAGMVPTGGYNITVKSVTRDPKRITVVAPVVPPSAGTMVTQVISYPYILIAVPTKDVREVRWLDASGRDVETTVPGGLAIQ